MEQQERKQPSRWEVHQAIEVAIQDIGGSGFEDALKTIIRYGATLPVHSVEFEVRFPGKKHDSVQGHVEGMGNVEIPTDDHGKPRAWKHGMEKDRVGHYRLWQPHGGQIAFHHYWASDEETNASRDPKDRPETYVILYNRTTLLPWGFGRFIYRESSLGLKTIRVRFAASTYESLWENKKNKEPLVTPEQLVAGLACFVGSAGTTWEILRGRVDNLFWLFVALYIIGFEWCRRRPIEKYLKK